MNDEEPIPFLFKVLPELAALLWTRMPERIPHGFRRTALRNLEWAGVPCSVAMKLTGRKTEAMYRRYAIASESDLSEGLMELANLQP